MSSGTSTWLLWLFVINLGIAFGAGLYEHRIVVSDWIATSPDGAHWNADVARKDDTGRRFWVFVTTVPLTLLTIANTYAAWHAIGPLRFWWLAAAVADRMFTFAYFIPAMVSLTNAPDSPEAASAAIRWSHLNYFRHAIVLVAWLAALQAFALVHRYAASSPQR